MARVLISYRRETGWALAGRLYDMLTDRFGSESIFIDIDDIDPGVDFVAVLEETLAAVDAVIPVIDRDWLDVRDASGNRRLDDPTDFVRREVAQALVREVLVIPLLEPGAAMPSADDLPGELRSLSRRNAVVASQKHFRADVDRIVASLEELRTVVDLDHLGPHAAAAQRILADSSERHRWERNRRIYYSIWAPAFGSAGGWFTMRAPVLAQLRGLDLSGDEDLAKVRDRLIALIEEAPKAEGRLESDKEGKIYDLLQTPDISLLLEEVRDAVRVLGDFASKSAAAARVRAYRDADVPSAEVDRWIRNDKVHRVVHIPGLGSDLPFGREFTRRSALQDLLDRLDFSSDPELESKRLRLKELIHAAPVEDRTLHDTVLDLRLTPEMQRLREEIDEAVHEHGEAARERR